MERLRRAKTRNRNERKREGRKLCLLFSSVCACVFSCMRALTGVFYFPAELARKRRKTDSEESSCVCVCVCVCSHVCVR